MLIFYSFIVSVPKGLKITYKWYNIDFININVSIGDQGDIKLVLVSFQFKLVSANW